MPLIKHEDQPEVASQRLEMARQDFLFGDPDTKRKPCRNEEKLAMRYQLDALVIAKHSRDWLAEEEARLEFTRNHYANSSDPDVVLEHKSDLEFLREQKEALKKELSRLQGLNLVGSEPYADTLKQLLKVEKRYAEKSGSENAIRVRAHTEKQVAAAAVKVATKERLTPAADKARKVSATIFDMGDDEPEQPDQ